MSMKARATGAIFLGPPEVWAHGVPPTVGDLEVQATKHCLIVCSRVFVGYLCLEI